jgi:tRNA (cmo5U34)-methyltransferase
MNMLADVRANLAIALRESRTSPGRARIPEPMVIDDPAAVRRFSEGGTSQPAMLSVYDFNARALNALVPKGGVLLDLGVGSGQALAYFLHRRPDVTAIGVDLSAAMLATARDMFAQCGMEHRVRLVEADAGDLPAEVAGEPIAAVSSLWTLHQLPDGDVLGAVLHRIAALRAQHGAAVWLLDFQRLADSRSFPDLLTATEPGYPASLRADAISSEAAAFRADELRRCLDAAGLGETFQRIAWPLRLLQAAWAPARGSALGGGNGSWLEVPVDRVTKRKAALLQRAFGASRVAPFPRRGTRPR